MRNKHSNKKATTLAGRDLDEKNLILNSSYSNIIALNEQKSKEKIDNFKRKIMTKRNISLIDIMKIIDFYIKYLNEHNFRLSKNGYPIFDKNMFLNEWPKLTITFTNRNNKTVKDSSKTLICFYDKDSHLYQRLVKVFEEINEYKRFLGVVGLDVTFTNDMDEEWQKTISLLNQLFLAILSCNDIKIVMNTRSASLQSSFLFENVPHNIMCASGFLGCKKTKSKFDFTYLSKILSIMPSKLLIYGKHDKIVEEQLDMMGISYRTQKDFHSLCKEVK